MPRRKSLLHGMDIENVVAEAVINRVLGKERALKKFALGYKRSQPEFAGWVLFLANEIEKHRDELMRLPPKERSARVQDLVADAARRWREMDSEERKKWIENAKSILAEEKMRLQESMKFADEIERLAEEAVRAIEELAEVVT